MRMVAFSNGTYRTISDGELPNPFEFLLENPSQEQINSILGEQIRSIRSDLLRSTDWTQMSDSPMSTDIKAMWASYRQALRDIPEQVSFPSDVVWPVEPSNDS